jgi:8-oxo-dGTP pyrophosphatase MutT (NUDIX family)
MAEVVAVPAASVLVLRDGPDNGPLEVLMMRRRADASFVPDAWVFPGGAVDDEDRALGDGLELSTMRIAAARELFEETGVWLGAPLTASQREKSFAELLDESPIDFERLVWTSHWITPFGVPKRFDTWFFLTQVSRDVIATAAEAEAVELAWLTPAAALAQKKELRLVFPTIKNLEAIVDFTTAVELIDSRRGADIQPIQPLIADGRIRMP